MAMQCLATHQPRQRLRLAFVAPPACPEDSKWNWNGDGPHGLHSRSRRRQTHPPINGSSHANAQYTSTLCTFPD